MANCRLRAAALLKSSSVSSPVGISGREKPSISRQMWRAVYKLASPKKDTTEPNVAQTVEMAKARKRLHEIRALSGKKRSTSTQESVLLYIQRGPLPEVLIEMIEKREQAAIYRTFGLRAAHRMFSTLTQTDEKARLLIGLLEAIHENGSDSHFLADLEGCASTVIQDLEMAWSGLCKLIVESCLKWVAYFSDQTIQGGSKRVSIYRALLCGMATINLDFRPADSNLIRDCGLLHLLSQVLYFKHSKIVTTSQFSIRYLIYHTGLAVYHCADTSFVYSVDRIGVSSLLL